jgi:hypothetical protein
MPSPRLVVHELISAVDESTIMVTGNDAIVSTGSSTELKLHVFFTPTISNNRIMECRGIRDQGRDGTRHPSMESLEMSNLVDSFRPCLQFGEKDNIGWLSVGLWSAQAIPLGIGERYDNGILCKASLRSLKVYTRGLKDNVWCIQKVVESIRNE